MERLIAHHRKPEDPVSEKSQRPLYRANSWKVKVSAAALPPSPMLIA